MDLVDVFKIALKRWYVVLAILVVGGIAAVLLASSVAPEYTIQTQSILVNGSTVDQEQSTTDSTVSANPYLRLSGNEFTMLSAMTRRVDGAEYRKQIADEGYDGKFVFSAAQEAPVVITDVTASSPQAAADLSERVQQALRDALADLQAEAGATPTSDQIIMKPLTTSDPHEEVGSRNRVLFGMLGVTVAAAIGGAVLVESLVQSRRRRVDDAPVDDHVDEEEFEALERIRSLFGREEDLAGDIDGPNAISDHQSRETGT